MQGELVMAQRGRLELGNNILLYFTEFDSFAGLLRHSGWREIYIVCRISSSTFGQNWPTLQRDLSAIAELLVVILPPDKNCRLTYLLTYRAMSWFSN